MAHDFSVAPLAATSGISPVDPGAEPPAPAPTPSQIAAVSLIPNPKLRMDAASGIVVIEFRDLGGKLQNSIPNQHQLDAYSGRSATTLTDRQPSRIA